MKLLDKILHQRLKRIRDELNSYIIEKMEYESCEISVSMGEAIFAHTPADEIVEKFLDMHPFKEDNVADFSFSNEENDDAEQEQIPSVPIRPLSAPTCPPHAMQSVSAPARPMPSSRPSEMPIPDFLRSECQKRTIDEVLKTKAETFSVMLLRLIDEKELKDSEVYKKANIDRRLFSKIRGDEDYVPSKKTAISFC